MFHNPGFWLGVMTVFPMPCIGAMFYITADK
jgi:hypothetical protein